MVSGKIGRLGVINLSKRQGLLSLVAAVTLLLASFPSGAALALEPEEELQETVEGEEVTVSDLELAPTSPSKETDTNAADTNAAQSEDAGEYTGESADVGNTEDTADTESIEDNDYNEDGSLVAHVVLDAPVLIAGLSWPGGSELAPTVVYRLHDEENGWQEWNEWGATDATAESDPESTVGTDELVLAGSDILEVSVENVASDQSHLLSLHIIDPVSGTTTTNQVLSNWQQAKDIAQRAQVAHFSLVASNPPTEQLTDEPTGEDTEYPMTRTLTTPRAASYDTKFEGLKITTRAGWGANESWRKWGNDPIKVKGAVIHHTAGSNNYTKAQVPDVIRGIYYYHAVTLGWGDIGYHLLVDKYGGVWQGRYGALNATNEGAHAYGANGSTFGVSVLGDYMKNAPSDEAIDSVAKVVAWKLAANGITSATGKISVPGNYGNGKTIYTVSGHRDVGGTDCPGNAFYSQMGSLRAKINSYLKKTPVLKTQTSRVSGATRVETAAALAKSLYPKGASEVYLVNQHQYADALAAGMLKSGPVLFVDKNSIPKATSQALKDMNPEKVFAIGGVGVVSDAVLRTASAGSIKGARLGGVNRIETASKIANQQFGNKATPIYFADGFGADGKGSPDAVAGGNLTNGPVLLTRARNGLEATNQAQINKRKGTVYELGGGNLGTGSKKKLSGKDRYATSAVIAQHAFGTKADTVYLANGSNYIDALAAGSISKAPRLLVKANTIPDPVCNYLRQTRPEKIIALGGSSVISNATLAQARTCATS